MTNMTKQTNATTRVKSRQPAHNAVSMNDTATRTLPRFQDVLKNELAKLSGGSFDAPSETSEEA